MKSIYFHEDDYCQIEILPIQNYNYCKKEIEKIEDFSEEHKVDGGIGWTDVYVRGENPIPLAELNISIDMLSSLLEEITTKFETVKTGYSSYREVCQHIIAYGKSNDVVLFFDFDKGSNYVKNIWLTLDVSNEKERDSAKKILSVLSKVHELILVDWCWDFVTKLNDSLSIENYLNERIEAFVK